MLSISTHFVLTKDTRWKIRAYGSVIKNWRTGKVLRLDQPTTKLFEYFLKNPQTINEKCPSKERQKLINLVDLSLIEGLVAPGLTRNKCIKLNNKTPLDSVIIRLTNNCNLRCKHCFVDAGKPKIYEMDTLKIIDVLSEISQYKPFQVVFTGGEPLLRADIFEILGQTNDLEIPFDLSTNCLLLNKEKIVRLKNYTNLKSIVVSFEAAEPILHDSIRGKENYNQTLEAVKMLLNEGFNVTGNLCVTKINFPVIEQSIDKLLNMGLRSLHIAPVSMSGRAKINENALALTQDQRSDLAIICLKKSKSSGKVFFGEIEEENLWDAYYQEGVINCGAADRWCMIFPNGLVYPCRGFEGQGLAVGDLKGSTFEEIWNNSALLKTLRNLEVNQIEGCKDCDIKYSCGGGCRASAYTRNKSLFDAENRSFCESKRTMINRINKELSVIGNKTND